MENGKYDYNKLTKAAVMLLITVALAAINSFAGKQKGTPAPPYIGDRIFGIDNTVHLVIFNKPGSRVQLMKELHALGCIREMKLWHEYFIRQTKKQGADK